MSTDVTLSYAKSIKNTRTFLHITVILTVEIPMQCVYNESRTLLSKKEFRRLLDLVYIGNWILNSTRGDDRIADYDQVESKLFALCRENGMPSLVERLNGEDVPSRAFSDGGIHEAIADYEDTVFYEILAEELARRDMDYQPVSNENYDALVSRMDDYIAEFEAHGTDNISIPTMDE